MEGGEIRCLRRCLSRQTREKKGWICPNLGALWPSVDQFFAFVGVSNLLGLQYQLLVVVVVVVLRVSQLPDLALAHLTRPAGHFGPVNRCVRLGRCVLCIW